MGAERRLAHLLAFALRYRRYGLTNRPVRADTVSTALSAVAKGITKGQPDPRKQADGTFWPILLDFFRALQREDKPKDLLELPKEGSMTEGSSANLTV